MQQKGKEHIYVKTQFSTGSSSMLSLVESSEIVHDNMPVGEFISLPAWPSSAEGNCQTTELTPIRPSMIKRLLPTATSKEITRGINHLVDQTREGYQIVGCLQG